MPSKYYRYTYLSPYGMTVERQKLNQVWYHSPRDAAGQLMLRSNTHTRERSEVISRYATNATFDYYLMSAATNPSVLLGQKFLYDTLLAESYARLRGKLYKGSAALGVTAGSYAQSRSMIVSRYQQLMPKVSNLARILGGIYQRKPIRPARSLANTHLEVVFGWVPLYQDIWNAAYTVIQLAAQRAWVDGSARHEDRGIRVATYGLYKSIFVYGSFSRVRRSAQVVVNNPNLWLLERAGLLNPATVAWDLVPWSFAVNMFVNINSLVQSITDFAGLSFPDSSITRKTAYSGSYTVISSQPGVGECRVRASEKYTVPGGVGRPPLVLRLPGANWELAAIAASLATQKLGALKSLVR